MLEDVQQRIVFRAQRYIQTDIRGYNPAPGDLAYPDKLIVASEATIQDETISDSDSVFDTSGTEVCIRVYNCVCTCICVCNLVYCLHYLPYVRVMFLLVVVVVVVVVISRRPCLRGVGARERGLLLLTCMPCGILLSGELYSASPSFIAA